MKQINENKTKDYYIVEKITPRIFTRNWSNHNISLEDLGIKMEQIIVIVLTGSNMYGTATVNSDKDYLGIYIPTIDDILLNKVKHHITLKTDSIDFQIWSIYKFLDLACKGETMAIDLLHAPYNNWLLYNSHAWPILVNNRNLFYTKNMKSFVGYARTQAAKYSVKGSRLEELKKVIKFCKIEHSNTKLFEIWKYLPTGEHIHFLNDEKPYRMYQVCGRKFHETVKISYILEGLQKLLTSYGKRAKIAENNKGVD